MFRYAAFALAFSAALLSIAPALAQSPQRGGTLVLARPEEPVSFDPFGVSDNGSIFAIEQVCDSLIEADATGRGLRPGLAESWEMAPDGLSYDFTLRDARFSDGTPVTVDDVLFSWDRLRAPTTPYQFLVQPVRAVEKLDERHLRVTLGEPYAPFPSVASVFAAAIVKRAAYEADPQAFADRPLCAGPFVVESFARGTSVVLARNPYYWDRGADGRPLPYLGRIELHYVPDTNALVLGLENGDYDVAVSIPFSQARTVKARPGVTLEVADVYRIDYVYLNHKQKPLDDKRIRLALIHAADLDAINKAVYYGYGTPPNSINPRMTFWSSEVPRLGYDIAKARDLVAAAGYDGTPIRLMVDAGNAPATQVATILQQGWQAAGLNVRIDAETGSTWDSVLDGSYMAYVLYITSDLNDDDEILALQTDPLETGTQGFYSRYRNDEVTTLLKASRAATDPSRRAELFRKIQEITYNDAYSVPLAYTPSLAAHHARVKNWRTIAPGWWWLKEVWVEEGLPAP